MPAQNPWLGFAWPSPARVGRCWLAGLLFVGTALNITAQVWTGGTSTTWSTAGNWSGGVPGAGATATFSSNTARDPNLTAAASTGKLLFLSGADAEVFTGSTLTLSGVSGVGIDNQSGVTQTFSNALTVSSAQSWNAGNGDLAFGTVTLNNTLTLTGAAAFSFGGSLVQSGGNRTLTNNATGSVTLTGGVTGNSRTLTVTGTGDTTIGGTIATTTGGLVKSGAGTLTLSGNNTYSGTTTVNAGTLAVAHDNALGTGGLALVGGTLSSIAGNTLANVTTLSGNATLRDVTLSGTFTQRSANRTLTLDNATLAGTVNLSNNNTGRVLTAQVDAGTSTISGVIQNGGTGAGGLTKTGAGTLLLTGASTYTGDTTINQGTLQLGAAEAIANISDVTVAAGATFDVNGQTETIASLAGAGTVALGGGSLTTAGNASTVFGGDLAGTGDFTKLGTGTLTLTNSFSFAGTYNLGGGTLRLSDISLSLGTLNITGNSFLDFAGAASTLNVSSFNIAAGVTLTIQNWANATDFFFAQNWTGAAFNVTGSAPMNQITFTGFAASDTKWQGYDSQITPVPEPGTYGAGLLGLGGVLLAWRRRRQGSP